MLYKVNIFNSSHRRYYTQETGQMVKSLEEHLGAIIWRFLLWLKSLTRYTESQLYENFVTF